MVHCALVSGGGTPGSYAQVGGGGTMLRNHRFRTPPHSVRSTVDIPMLHPITLPTAGTVVRHPLTLLFQCFEPNLYTRLVLYLLGSENTWNVSRRSE